MWRQSSSTSGDVVGGCALILELWSVTSQNVLSNPASVKGEVKFIATVNDSGPLFESCDHRLFLWRVNIQCLHTPEVTTIIARTPRLRVSRALNLRAHLILDRLLGLFV